MLTSEFLLFHFKSLNKSLRADIIVYYYCENYFILLNFNSLFYEYITNILAGNFLLSCNKIRFKKLYIVETEI